MTPPLAAYLGLAYLSGAIPWAVWLGRLFYGMDPRTLADGNPGAANAFRLGGWPLGGAVLVLDYAKAFVPVLVAHEVIGYSGSDLLWIALMPTAGHAFSIFLGFRGGRALVTLFGVWSGLTRYEVPLVMGGAAIAAVLLLKRDVPRTLAVPLGLIAYLLLRSAPGWMVVLGVAQLAILLLKLLPFILSGSTVEPGEATAAPKP